MEEVGLTVAAGGRRWGIMTWLAVLLLFLAAAVPVALEQVAQEVDLQVTISNIIDEVAKGSIDSAVQQFTTAGDNSMIPSIVTGVYGSNAANTDNLLSFVKRLPGMAGIGLGFEAVYDEMKRGGHLGGPHATKLAAEIGAVMDLCLFDHVAPQDQARFTTMREHFPGVLWNTACLKSTFYDEYVFAGDDRLARCSKRRNVFAWRRKGKALGMEWTLEPSVNGGPNSFRLRNHFYNEYLFVEDMVLCGRRRRVFTWRPRGALPGGSDWLLEPADGGLFRIKNVAYNEYLYASDDGHSRSYELRSLFTWRHKTEAVPVGGLWKIELC